MRMRPTIDESEPAPARDLAAADAAFLQEQGRALKHKESSSMMMLLK